MFSSTMFCLSVSMITEMLLTNNHEIYGPRDKEQSSRFWCDRDPDLHPEILLHRRLLPALCCAVLFKFILYLDITAYCIIICNSMTFLLRMCDVTNQANAFQQ